jgi:hypothetical protein
VQSESSSVEPESSSVESESSSIEPESRRFESSSSVDSFGTSTGFLHRAESEERPTTPEYEPTTPEYVPTTPEYVPTTPVYVPTTPVFRYVRPSVQPPTRFPVNKQRLTQTETIIPGKITETKIFANAPSQTFIVSEPIPVRQSQLSQGSTLLLFLLAALAFCTFLMASTIAVVSSFRDERISKTKAAIPVLSLLILLILFQILFLGRSQPFVKKEVSDN